MRVNDEIRLEQQKNDQNEKKKIKGGVSNRELVEKNTEKLQTFQVQTLLQDIESVGERLARSRKVQDLFKYKELVQKFIKDTVDHSLEVKQFQGKGFYGYQQTLKIVATIDQKQLELTEEVMKKEEKSILILEKIGEIKGLLINLYT